MKIVTADTPLMVQNITSLIFGEPGIGKTSYAFTSHNPLLLDTDDGAYRSAFRKDIVQVPSWEVIASITTADVKDYDTVVIDTVGRMLDLLSEYIVRTNPKMAQKSGALTQRGYGELKAVFLSWSKRIRMMQKDLIFIAHNKEERDGDEIIIRPDIQGGSYSEVFKVSDSVGYMFRHNKQTVLEFTPTERHVGKDTATIGIIELPNFNQDPKFAETITQKTKDTINLQSQAGRDIVFIVDKFRSDIPKLSKAIDFDNMMSGLAKTTNEIAVRQVKQLMANRLLQTTVTWDKTLKKFIDSQPEKIEPENQKLESVQEKPKSKKDIDFLMTKLFKITTKENLIKFEKAFDPQINGLDDKARKLFDSASADQMAVILDKTNEQG